MDQTNGQFAHSTPRPALLLRALIAVLLLGTALGIGFAGGMATMWLVNRTSQTVVVGQAPAGAPVDDDEARQQGLSRLDRIIDILEQEFYEADKLDITQMLQGAARGLVASVDDPYTVYVEPVQASILAEDMSGAFEGIGATVNSVDQGLVIVALQAGGPAVRANLQVGDLILQADDASLAGLSLLDAVALVRGPKGTVVRLLIQREGVQDPFVVPVTRDRVETPVVETRMLEGDIAYLYLAEFNALAHDQLVSGLKELIQQKPAGLILDLRGNPGGLLDMAVAVASEFLPVDTLVVTQRWSNGTEQEYRVRIRGSATDIPMVVLTNGGSASASEIVAGALRDHERATLIGEPTFGKGAVQNVHKLDDGASLRVTVSKYYMPDGESPDLDPIEPDITIALSAEDVSSGADPQLDRAVEYLQSGK